MAVLIILLINENLGWGDKGAGHGGGELFRDLGLGKLSQAEMGPWAFPLGDEELGQPCRTWSLLPPTPQPVQGWFRGDTRGAQGKKTQFPFFQT